jgi:hypothetical protein
MKVKIGKPRYLSLYPILKAIFSETLAAKIWEWKVTQKVVEFLNSKFQRKVKVKLDPWDTWSLDNTLAQIIHPALVQLKETNHGIFAVENEDVPEELRTKALNDSIEWDYCEKRYEYVMNEMIWAFEQIKKDNDGDNEMLSRLNYDYSKFDSSCSEKAKAWDSRIDNGCRLFGKYYRALWD